MGGGCSSQRAVHVTDKDTRVQLRKKLIDDDDDLIDPDVIAAQNALSTLSKAEQKQIGQTMKKGMIEEDFEASVEDLDKFAQPIPDNVGKYQNIWDAIDANDYKVVEYFLDQNELRHEDLYEPNGNTMLHKAAGHGHVEILMLLIDRTGAKPEIVNQNLATPMHLACRANQEHVVKFLVGLGVDANLQDEHGQTPLLVCCIHGHINIARILVDSGNAGHIEPIDVDCKDLRGLTSLNCAAIKGDFQFVSLLVEKGNANIEEASPKGCTPLLYAGRGGFTKIVKLLVEKGANTMRQDNAGGTVSHHAIEKGQQEIVQILIDNEVDMDIADNAGRTPLFEAVENNQESIVSLLIQHKANPDITNYSGHTPLYCACREGDDAIVRILVTGYAKIDYYGLSSVRNDDLDDDDIDDEYEKALFEGLKCSKTPLHVACLLGYFDIVKILIENGANPNIEGDFGYNSLHFSILGRKPEIAEYLLLNTAVNAFHKDRKGRSCKQMALKQFPEYKDDFEKLLKGKSPDENINGLTPVKEEANESIQGLNDSANIVVATHYYNPDDERSIQGVDKENNIYSTANEAAPLDEESKNDVLKIKADDIKVEFGKTLSTEVQTSFGELIALGLISQNWKHKESALSHVLAPILPKVLEETEKHEFEQAIKAACICVSETCQDKVIKVFTSSIALFQFLISANQIEEKGLETFVREVTELEIISKLLLKSEDGNNRSVSKVHESLMDFSFHPGIGEGFVASYIISRICAHIKMSVKASAQEDMPTDQTEEDDVASKKPTQFKPPISGQNQKGLLAQLQLLYKFVTTFGVQLKQGPLSIQSLKQVLFPNLQHSNADIRSGSQKIMIEIHKRTGGIVDEEFLKDLPTKARSAMLQKLEGVQLLTQPDSEFMAQQKENISPSKKEVSEALNKAKNQEWGEKEFSLKRLKEEINQHPKHVMINENFTRGCIELMESCLAENNITLHLASIDLANVFFQHALQLNYDACFSAITELAKPLCLMTTHTNTRLKKKSEECLLYVWDGAFNHINSKFVQNVQNSETSISAKIIESVIQNDEKALAGRLGVLTMRIQRIIQDQGIARVPHQVLMGKNYVDIMQFCVTWSGNKNSKVRQAAAKTIIEICKLNASDQQGTPFRQKLVQQILGLKPTVRDPIINKINQVCKPLLNGETFIQVDVLQNYDGKRGRHMSQERIQQKRTFSQNSLSGSTSSLPQIAKQSSVNRGDGMNQETIVLPHSEPLTEEQKQKYSSQINLFSEPFIGCFLSQSWSNRNSALLKLKEQASNLDPNMRDTMKAEINKQNYYLEESYPIVIDFLLESITKDPVLKNYLLAIELLQKLMPIYFRGLSQNIIQRGLTGLIEGIINKTSDLKTKVREASHQACIYLSHQSPIGPEFMVKQVISSLRKTERQKDVASNISNSNLWTSCINILNYIQKQCKIASQLKGENTQIFMKYVNVALKHNTPSVRKAGEDLFITLYELFGQDLEDYLVSQKPAIVKKLLDLAQSKTGTVNKDQEVKENVQKAQKSIQEGFIPKNSIFGSELITDLRDPKKKQKVLVDIKKSFIQQTGTSGMNQAKALELCEPITFLMRQLLNDETGDIYLESLQLLKFFISTLAAHLSTLDLHILISSFVGIIVGNTISSNMRIQMASDKVILYFAKHQSIGPHVVGKDILKNIQRLGQSLNKFTNSAAFNSTPRGTALTDKKPVLMRFLNILQLLLQQFSLVLCYQPEFMDFLVECMGELLVVGNDEPSVKRTAIQILGQLHQIDTKVLEVSSGKLEVTKRTLVRKAIIELENLNKNGKNVLTQDHHQFSNVGGSAGSQGMSPNTNKVGSGVPSNRNSSSRTTLFSPNGTEGGASRQISRQATNSMDNPMKMSDGFNGSSSRGFRRMISEEDNKMLQTKQDGQPPSAGGDGMSISQARRAQSLRRQGTQEAEKPGADYLPEINQRRAPNQGRALPPISKNSGLGTMGNSMGPLQNQNLNNSGNYPVGIGGYTPSMGAQPTKPSRFMAGSSDGFSQQNQTTRPPIQGAGLPLPGQEPSRPPIYAKSGRQSDALRTLEENKDPFRESQTRRFQGAQGPSPMPNMSGDFNKFKTDMNDPGMRSSGPVKAQIAMPVATFEHGTGGYVNRKAQNVEKDILDEEIKRFNY